MRRVIVWLVLIVALIVAAIWSYRHWIQPQPTPPIVVTPPIIQPPQPPTLPEKPPVIKPTIPKEVEKVIDSVFTQVQVTRSYDPTYVQLKYPNGDVPLSTGVCADVIVRAFRANGVDLQKELHEDMKHAFHDYPQKWKLPAPDTNIDHRRVYNLMKFFERKGKALPVSNDPAEYKTGDIVTWDLGTGQAHIGIVMQYKTEDGQRPLIGHNVGEGTSIQDVLFAWRIIGHYRYFDPQPTGKTQSR